MTTPFDTAWRRAEARLDAAFGEPLVLRPMARGDVNGRSGPDGARAVLSGLTGVFRSAPEEMMVPDGRVQGAAGGVKHHVARTTVSIVAGLLPYAVRVDDVIERPAEMDGARVIRAAEVYRVTTPGVPDAGGRVTLGLAAVIP